MEKLIVTTRHVALASEGAVEKRGDAVKMAQVGLAGGIGYTHINEVERNPHFVCAGGYDLYPEEPRVKAAIERLRKKGAKIYGSLEELLTDPDVEAVDLCTPHHFHRPMSVAALRAGKHVLVEKPMATHPDDCAAMVEATRVSGKVGAVQMQHTGRKGMLKLREAIQGGAIGGIREVFMSSFWWRGEDYFKRTPWAGRMKVDGAWCVDGALYNQCVHYVNQMLTLVSPGPMPSVARVKNVKSAIYKFHEAPNLEAGDTAFITGVLLIAGEPRMTAIGTTCAKEERHFVEVIGEKGRALWNGTGYLMVDGEPAVEFHDDHKPFDGNSAVFNSFAEAVRGKGEAMTSFEQIQRVTELAHKCYEVCGWEVKKVAWGETAGLFGEVVGRVRKGRCLPSELEGRPGWA